MTLASSRPGWSQGPSEPKSTLRGPARSTASASRSKRRTPGGVGVDVGQPRQRVDESLLGGVVVGEAAEVRDDEIDLREFGGEKLDRAHLAQNVVEDRQPARARHLADLAVDPGVGAVHLEAAAAPAERLVGQEGDPPAVAGGVHESETPEPAAGGEHLAADLAVGRPVVAVEGGEDHRAADAGRRRPLEVGPERGGAVPGTDEAVPRAGVAVAVDDRHVSRLTGLSSCRSAA